FFLFASATTAIYTLSLHDALPISTEEAPAIAENTQPEPEAPAAAPAEPEQQPAPTEQTENRELPRTAGELPLIALIGLLCLGAGDRKSTRLNSSHVKISYAVFCLK